MASRILFSQRFISYRRTYKFSPIITNQFFRWGIIPVLGNKFREFPVQISSSNVAFVVPNVQNGIKITCTQLLIISPGSLILILERIVISYV